MLFGNELLSEEDEEVESWRKEGTASPCSRRLVFTCDGPVSGGSHGTPRAPAPSPEVSCFGGSRGGTDPAEVLGQIVEGVAVALPVDDDPWHEIEGRIKSCRAGS